MFAPNRTIAEHWTNISYAQNQEEVHVNFELYLCLRGLLPDFESMRPVMYFGTVCDSVTLECSLDTCQNRVGSIFSARFRTFTSFRLVDSQPNLDNMVNKTGSKTLKKSFEMNSRPGIHCQKNICSKSHYFTA